MGSEEPREEPEEAWTDYPHLAAKLLLGFVGGLIAIALFGYFIAARLSDDPNGLSPAGVAASGVVGLALIYPIGIWLFVKPNIERFQREQRDS